MISHLASFPNVLAHFEKNDPKIAHVLKQINLSDWFEERPSSDHFFNLTRNIIYQQLAGAAADTIFTRFKKLVVDINPLKVLSISDQSLRDVGLSWAKVSYVKDLATKVISKEVVLENISNLDNETIVSELTKVKGIGRWTAEMFLLFTLHREDIFSFGDLGLKNGISKLYGITEPNASQIKNIIRKWTPYSSYGSIALWHHLDNR